MRVSIPTIPHTAKPIPNVTLPEAIKRLTDFLRGGATTVLTGAGVSVDSGIKAYRGQDGRYMNPNFQPIFYHELIDETDKGHRFRQRYWLRSYLGYPPVKNAVPNVSHISLAALQHASVVPNIITQVKLNAFWFYLWSSFLKVFERTSTGYTRKPFNKLPHINGTQHTHATQSWNCMGLYIE